MKAKKQVLLVIFDGWGVGKKYSGNAIDLAKKPYFDSLWETYPHTTFNASGEAVGLPEGNIGSSEIAHTIIGAGAVIDTDLVRLNKLSQTDEIAESPAIRKAFENAKKHNSVLHLCGQVSPGGVHSHQDHLFALLRAAKKAGLTKVAIHAFLDGRDMPPTSGHMFLKQLEEVTEELGVGFIASMSGRYYAMDRDNRWDRLAKVEDVMFKGIGREGRLPASKMLQELYKDGEEDEFIVPVVFADQHGEKYSIGVNDSVIFFNFRADRARMLDLKLSEKAKFESLCFVTITEHNPDLDCLVAYPPIEIKTTLGEQISKAGLTQAHVSETEKYAHVTYFLNGGNEKPYPKEEDFLIPSNKDVATYDHAPEMKATEIADQVIEQLERGIDFVVVNFANADMVGHTGDLKQTIRAIEVLDIELKRVVETVLKLGGVAFITADHGNAEFMIDETSGEKITAHSTNPVPGILTDPEVKLRDGGGLADVAPTVLDILGIEKPAEMTGQSLLDNK